jgi:hypothetical protein
MYSDGFRVISFPRDTLFVIHPLFKAYPYANKSKKIINKRVKTKQITEQTKLWAIKTAHLKAQN